MTRRYFIHIDADAFFASVEQCLHKELRGKAVVAGRDGSIAVALSYEAKALGVERATPIHIIREQFPTVQMVASDYAMYRIFSDRMLSIIEEHIPQIQRKSIDECACEISHLVASFPDTQELAQKIKYELETKLGCTFSFGISTSPLLAKMASDMNKPSGITLINPKENKEYFELPIRKVPGLGHKLSQRLSSLGIVRIRDFITRYPSIRKNFSVVTDDIYQQVQGQPSLRIRVEKEQQSMNRARSFKVTRNKDEVFGQMMLNAEHLMRKLRAQKLVCTKIHLSLRNAERKYIGSYIKTLGRTRDSQTLCSLLEKLFDELWDSQEAYRYVSVTFSGLQHEEFYQSDLFGGYEQEQQRSRIDSAIDRLNDKFGTAVVSRASTLFRPAGLGSHISKERFPITERYPLLPHESPYRRLRYPYLGTI